MTKPRPAHSPHEAWVDTGKVLGWPALAELCEREVDTVRQWSDPEKCPAGPPTWATDLADRRLKEESSIPFNFWATGVRIGEHAHHPAELLARVKRELDLAVLAIESCPSEDWKSTAVRGKLTEAMGAFLRVMRHTDIRAARAMDEKKEAAGDPSRFPGAGQAGPALRTVAGGR